MVNSGSAPTSDGPKSLTMTSIWSYFAMAAVSTFWLRAGSQLVTSKGCSPIIVYFSGSSVWARPSASPRPWLLPLGPLRKSTLPPSGRISLIQLPQLTPSLTESSPTYFVKSTPSSPPGSTR